MKYIIVNTYRDMEPDTATTYVGVANTRHGVKKVILEDIKKHKNYYEIGDYAVYENVGRGHELLRSE